MNLRFQDNYNEIPVDYLFNEPQYTMYPYQEQAHRRCLFDYEHNYFLNELNVVRKDEDQFFNEPPMMPYMDSLEAPNILDCLSLTLKMPIQMIQQISQTNQIGFQKLIDKARRVIRREKARIRVSLRLHSQPEQLISNVAEEIKMKIEEDVPIISNTSSPDDKSKSKQKKNVLGKRKAEKERKEQQVDESDYSIQDVISQLGNITNANSDVPTENEKQQKKKVQMIRNRISAQNSRDRKKAYIYELESNSAVQQKQNYNLQMKIRDLQEQAENIKQSNQLLKMQLDEVNERVSDDKQQVSKEQDSVSNKNNYKKIGLTLLTMISVFMMMTKVSDADSQGINNLEIDQNIKQSSSGEYHNLVAKEMSNNKDSVSSDINENGLIKKLKIFQCQMQDLMKQGHMDPGVTSSPQISQSDKDTDIDFFDEQPRKEYLN